jgi:hypothetical protein
MMPPQSISRPLLYRTTKSLNDCRHALVWYRRELQDGSYGIKSREIGDLVSEIDRVAETAFV